MTTQIWKNCKCYLGSYDLSGDLNAMALNYSADMLEATVFGQDTHVKKGGLRVVTASHQGLWQGGTGLVDHVLFSFLGIPDMPMTLCPTDGSVGETAFSFVPEIAKYSPGASIGEILKFSVNAEATGILVRGNILENGLKTASGSGVAVLLRAVGAAQYLFGALHVTTIQGGTPSITVKIQSDDNSGFTSPTDRITFTAATGITYQWAAPLLGAISDTYWRANWAITGSSTPGGTIIVFMGIQATTL